MTEDDQTRGNSHLTPDTSAQIMKNNLEQQLHQFILEKIKKEENSLSDIEKLVNLFLIVSMNQQQVRENRFSKIMTYLLLGFGISIGIASAFVETPIVFLVAGLFLLGGSMRFKITPDYTLKLIDQLNIDNASSKVTSSNLDKTKPTEDEDKNDDSETEK